MEGSGDSRLRWFVAGWFVINGIGCGSGRAAPQTGNQIEPIIANGCAELNNDGLSGDQRSLIAIVAAFDATRYRIYQVSPLEFKVFTEFREHRGVTLGWEAQVYSNGSIRLSLPATMPEQNARAMAYVEKWGQKIAATFDRLKCEPINALKLRVQAAGFKL